MFTICVDHLDVQVSESARYHLEPMPVPAVLVILAGLKGGLIYDEDTGKEVCFTKCK